MSLKNETSAKVILDSISLRGDRITTFELCMWRGILAEFNTHRIFSRNSNSSRAIPLSKQLSRVMEDPFIPKVFKLNQAGMQAAEPLDETGQQEARKIWLQARDAAVYRAEQLGKLNVHKQWSARILEPFMWHTVILTATDLQNFFDQRRSSMAQPEMEELADRMHEAYMASTPQVLQLGQWHTPYLREEDYIELSKPDQLKVSTARCARVSYRNQAGIRSIEDDLALWDRLKTGNHLSPMEHVARPLEDEDGSIEANFRGWVQLRRYIEMKWLDMIGMSDWIS